MSNDKISVIMAVYNCACYLPEAIESIINQTYTNWELIICDDASTDDTYYVAEKYQHKYPNKIILIRNDNNKKLSFSLNRCLEYATGNYIARMDGDDKCRPERFELQVSFLKSHPQYDLVGTAMQRFNGSELGMINYSIDNPNYYTMRRDNPFHHATILTYKYVYDRVGGYTVSSRTVRGQDYDLWFKFYYAGFQGYNLKEPLYLVREDSNAIRRRNANVRINVIKTTIVGFKMLNYPWWWLIEPVMKVTIKCLVPYRIIDIYRMIQNKKWQK